MPAQYPLLDSPPLASPDAKGIRILLESSKAGQLSPGDPVLFRGYRVGSVETSTFDTQKRRITYQLFINAPNDRLVTTNVRFWKDSGIAVDLTSAGMRVEMGSLSTLFGGGVSFDIPEGLDLGEPVANKTEYHLFDDQKSIQIQSLPSISITSCSSKTRFAACSRARRWSSAVSVWAPSAKCRSLFRG